VLRKPDFDVVVLVAPPTIFVFRARRTPATASFDLLSRTQAQLVRVPADYPRVLKTLADHLQKRRLDLGLQWKQVAALIGRGNDRCQLVERTHRAGNNSLGRES
jgi:hypothetical protein